MTLRYIVALVVCGFGWWGVSLALLDYVTPLASLLASLGTALVVGLIQRRSIQTFTKGSWFALPLLSVLIAMAGYGVLEPIAEWLTGGHTWSSPRADLRQTYQYPLWFVFYGLTLCIWFLYPLALGTHFALRKWALPRANMAA